MESLTAIEITALLRFHINDTLGIDAARIATLAEALKAAQRREASAPRAIA